MMSVSLGLRALAAMALSVAAFAVSGCSSTPSDQPPLGLVCGTVTMDGEPLPNVEVVFAPESGRVSDAVTDSTGSYELFYVSATRGAKVGRHKVFIQPAEILEDSPPVTKRVKIPAKYNSRSDLTAEVKPGSNTIDFALESKK